MANETNTSSNYSGHVLVFPYPIQGHVNPMLQFSKRLISKGIKVTFIITPSLSNLLPPQSESSPIQIRSIFDGHEDGVRIIDPETYLKSFNSIVPISLAQLIEEYKETSYPVKYIVYDCIISWVIDVARTAGIEGAAFFTQSLAVDAIHYHVYEGGLKLPIKGDLISVPAIPLLRQDEMPSLLVNVGCFPVINCNNINQSSNFDKANVVFINTTDKLEPQVLKWMKSKWVIKTIGPTIPSMYLDKRLEDDKEYGLSFFKAETDAYCLKWLDEKESDSVIYISMGSLVSLEQDQMEEIANGLVQTQKYFLWVVRASEEDKLPLNFKSDVSEKGLIVNWCPQLEVLTHRAIGCFMTHCGWNSTLEAISLGVPALVAMPQWADQPTNAKYIDEVWRIGVRLKVNDKGIVTKEEFNACILKVMEGEHAREIKGNMLKLKKVLHEAMQEGGTSDKNIEEFVAKVKNM